MHFLLPLLLVLLPISLTAQATDVPKTVPIIAYWGQGDVYRFRVQKAETRWKNDQLLKADTTHYTAVFTVMDSTATSYRIRWQFEDYQTTNSGADKLTSAPPELMTAVANYNDLAVEYTTNELGALQKIDNMDTIMNLVHTVGDALVAQKDVKVRQRMRDAYRTMMTPAFVQNSFLNELTSFHEIYGSEYNVKDTTYFEGNIPSAWTGEPIRTQGTMFADTIVPAERYVHFKLYNRMDKEDMRRVMEGLFERMRGRIPGVTPPVTAGDTKDFNQWQFDVRDHNDYQLYYDFGLVVYLDIFRAIVASNDEETNLTERHLTVEWVD